MHTMDHPHIIESNQKEEYITVLPGLAWPPFFANYSIFLILIEKEITYRPRN